MNGKQVSFSGKAFREIGEIILEASSAGNGTDIRLELTPEEEVTFAEVAGQFIGRAISELLSDAWRKKTGGSTMGGWRYTYQNFVFQTSPLG